MVRLRRLHLRRFFLRSHFDLAFVVGVKVGAAGDKVKVFVGGVVVIVAIAEVLVVGVLVVLVGVCGYYNMTYLTARSTPFMMMAMMREASNNQWS